MEGRKISSITIQQGELEDKIYLCADCLVLYTQLDMLRNKFVVKVSNPELKCSVCGRAAKFVIVPVERGIRICKQCYKTRVKRNHPWASFKVIHDYDENEVCDLCGRKGAKLIMPLSQKEREPVLSVEEDILGR